MAGITLAQAEAQLAYWLTADASVSTGQAVQKGDKSLTNVSAKSVRENITYWDAQVKRLSRGGIRISGGTPT